MYFPTQQASSMLWTKVSYSVSPTLHFLTFNIPNSTHEFLSCSSQEVCTSALKIQINVASSSCSLQRMIFSLCNQAPTMKAMLLENVEKEQLWPISTMYCWFSMYLALQAWKCGNVWPACKTLYHLQQQQPTLIKNKINSCNQHPTSGLSLWFIADAIRNLTCQTLVWNPSKCSKRWKHTPIHANSRFMTTARCRRAV